MTLPQRLEAGGEGRVADLAAQHVKQHQRLAVADGLRGVAVAAAKIAQREVAPVGGEAGVALQQLAPVFRPPALRLLDQMVGQIGGEPLRPVARARVHPHPVAPPVVQDLVRQRTVQDEGQAQHARPEQGEAGHAVAGLPAVFDHREARVGVGADQRAVEIEVLPHHRQIAFGQRRIVVEQPGVEGDFAVGAGAAGEATGQQVDVVLRGVGLPAPAVGAAPALADRLPVGGQRDAEAEGGRCVTNPRHPAAGAVQIGAVGVEHGARHAVLGAARRCHDAAGIA